MYFFDKTEHLLPEFNSSTARRYRRWREIKDNIFRHVMTAGGVGVILAIVLIAFYLFYVVLPMFQSAHIESINNYTIPGKTSSKTIYYALEEQREVALRLSANGDLTFFKAENGQVINSFNIWPDQKENLSTFAFGDPSQALISVSNNTGQVMLIKHVYEVSYPEDVRVIRPYIIYPTGKTPINMSAGLPVERLTAQTDGEQTTIAVVTQDQKLRLKRILLEENLLSGETELDEESGVISIENNATHLILDVEQRELYIATEKGTISYYNISDIKDPRLIQNVKATTGNEKITSLEFLSGGISILVGDSSGRITQWFPVRDVNNNYTLEQIRFFDSQSAAISAITPEYFRKSFVATDDSGEVGFYHTTAHRTVLREKISEERIEHLAIAPRANALLFETTADQKVRFWHVKNEHPEISWQSIWAKVWYESRDKPEYIWQSSSASSDFEPKFSLTPLLFGTLKAAFYAMLFAIPLSIFGAMYTAYFMSPTLRATVKPTIEIMEALPTVILGFLAGLWFAPFVEKNLPGIFMIILALPVSVLLTAYLWHLLPKNLKAQVPDGWEAALLIPVIFITGIFVFALSQPVENLFFNGNMPLWLTKELGLDFDQRNSLVVGVAMGFAVIPTIFSISEDAIYSVPKHLTTGSLALGATPWQTMVRVVLLTASPGIFSAVMIGLGRAVGETMIVVMATGNTAIMDMNIFQGFRALSANIAVEMPESEVGSTHYRILFLAGLVLFLVTFMFNTIAELVRQRLRTKYSSL